MAPALCAGNTIVIKPSEYTSATVLRLAELATFASSKTMLGDLPRLDGVLAEDFQR